MSKIEQTLKALGGVSAVAKALELTPSTVSSWIHKSNKIPRWHMKAVADLAAEKGVDLNALPESEAA
jgi:DNA-binding transcriptional regulator YdaS (Cro superfamily)